MNGSQTFSGNFIAALELVWGDGFLSPGGLEELGRIIGAIDISRARVLDIGCGIGGYSLGMLTHHAAGSVIGLDVEVSVLQRARTQACRSGLDQRSLFSLISPGPLPLADGCIDAVFSKDAFVGIDGKQVLFAELFRVLRPGGWLLAGDWLAGKSPPYSPAMTTWLGSIDVQLGLLTNGELQVMLAGSGFEDITITDRSSWAAIQTAQDREHICGKAMPLLIDLLGTYEANTLCERTGLRLQAITAGDLAPSHIRARKTC